MDGQIYASLNSFKASRHPRTIVLQWLFTSIEQGQDAGVTDVDGEEMVI